MAVSDAYAAVLKNDSRLLPASDPATVLLAGDIDNAVLAPALQNVWPSCAIDIPTTRNPVRLQTLARQRHLVLLCVRLEALDAVPSRRQQALIDKLGRLRQTLLLLCCDGPRAVAQWHRNLACLVWSPQQFDAALLAQLLAGKRDGQQLPFPLPFNGRHVERSSTGDWQMLEGRVPAFPAGHGLLTAS